jgi:surface protein
MFRGCSDITEIDFSNFNTSNVTIMQRMFFDCSSLTSLNLSNFNTSQVTRMNGMFYKCSSLTSLNLSNFNTSQVTEINNMFDGCINLEYINFQNFQYIIGWDENIFRNVPNNIVICVKNRYSYYIKNRLSNSNCYVIDCSIDWKSKQKKIINNGNGKCIESCNDDIQYKNEYNSKCYDNCPSGILLNNDNSEINECKCELEQCLTCTPVALIKNM